MTTIPEQANDNVNVAEIDEQEYDRYWIEEDEWITAEEWFHELGGMLLDHFGEVIRDGLNESLVRHGMKPLPYALSRNKHYNNADSIVLNEQSGLLQAAPSQ
jgi:hypothetical protein